MAMLNNQRVFVGVDGHILWGKFNTAAVFFVDDQFGGYIDIIIHCMNWETGLQQPGLNRLTLQVLNSAQMGSSLRIHLVMGRRVVTGLKWGYTPRMWQQPSILRQNLLQDQ